MKSRSTDLFLAAVVFVFVLVLSGCSMGLGGSGEPTPVYLPPSASEPVYPVVPGVHRYVDTGGRLVFPSPTLVPTPSPRPTRDFSRLLSTPEPTAESTPVPAGGRAELPSCVEQYRRMLLDYDGRLVFGAEVAWSLSEELKELRPDCVESGWNPVLDTGLTCVPGSIAGVDISLGLTRRLHSVALPRALPTAGTTGATSWSISRGSPWSTAPAAGTTTRPVWPGPGGSPVLVQGLTGPGFRSATSVSASWPPRTAATSARSTWPGRWTRPGVSCPSNAAPRSGNHFPSPVLTQTAGFPGSRAGTTTGRW